MGAFIGFNRRGVWATNRERDAFLDWFAVHRCQLGDARWQFCKSPAHRWTGFCVELSTLVCDAERLDLTDEEREQAEREYWPDLAQLLSIVDAITTGQWQIEVGSHEATEWRQGPAPDREVCERLGLLE